MNIKELKKNIINSGYRAVEELIKVAQDEIITDTEDDVSADRLKNADPDFFLVLQNSLLSASTISYDYKAVFYEINKTNLYFCRL